jgi:8-oxo-dGTP pyrophosphatase MutT (NUDIX family)
MILSPSNVHSRLARYRPAQIPPKDDTRFAAVAAVVRYRAAPEVLLIRRTSKPHDPWSGQMAFPGGRQEPQDADLRATAVRETREEVGLDLERDGELLGRLDDVQAIGRGSPLGMLIVPYVFRADEAETSALDHEEVEEAVWTPLEPMLSGHSATTLDYRHKGQMMTFPGYQVGQHVVWGLTYRMLQAMFDVLRG